MPRFFRTDDYPVRHEPQRDTESNPNPNHSSRFARLIERITLREADMRSVDSKAMPTVPLFPSDAIENYSLRDERLAHGTTYSVGPSVGNFSLAWITNDRPNLLSVVKRMQINGGAAATQIEVALVEQTIAASGGTETWAYSDVRSNRALGTDVPQTRVRGQLAAAVPLPRRGIKHFYLNANTTLDIPLNVLLINGFSLIVLALVQNVGISVNFDWYERAVEPIETVLP